MKAPYQHLLFDPPITSQVEATPPSGVNTQGEGCSDYVVYVDESGDHSLQSIDAGFPVFVLAFCVFHKKHYSERILPAIAAIKFRYFGHDNIVLHEAEIRKQIGPFVVLTNRSLREQFLIELDQIVEESNFILMACVVDKQSLSKTLNATNPYHLALEDCLLALHGFLSEKKQEQLRTHVVVECRGKKEDRELELEFRRICDGKNSINQPLPFEVIFADKKTNSTGLQLVDLVARPIAVSYIRPEQANRAFEVLKKKFYGADGREHVGSNYEGVGLLIQPPKKAKSPGEPTEAMTPTRNPRSI
jgi:Protein of unknown function (DUF3800)